MTNGATQTGASAEELQQAAPPVDTKAPAPLKSAPNPRDAVIDAMDDKIHADRIEEQNDFITEHAEELGMQPIQQAAPPAEPDPNADGALTAAPMHPPVEPPAPDPIPQDLQGHQMASYIVMHEGVPHMKAKVHGVDKLIPMERVQQQAQKLEAAEVSMQNAAVLQKDLAQREEWIRQNEAALKLRADQLATPPPDPGADDETLVTESRDIIKTLFSGDEDEAAQKLAGLMKRSRAPTAVAPAIDTTQIANQAAGIAVAQMTDLELRKDANTGLEQFGERYPELMADPILYNMTDNMTDVVEAEHPEWKPSAIMLEAGKRTTEWLNKQRGVTPPGEPPPQPPAGNDLTRQERKDNLVRIPNPALGAQSPHGEVAEDVQTPADALKEIRESRGQPV